MPAAGTAGRRTVRRSYSDSKALARMRAKNTNSSSVLRRKSDTDTSTETSPRIDKNELAQTTSMTTTKATASVSHDDHTAELTSSSSNSSTGSNSSNDPVPGKLEASGETSRPSTAGARPAPASRMVRRSHSFDSSVLTKRTGLKEPGATESDGYWSYNLNRKRLKGEMARQRLRQAFDSYSTRQANHNLTSAASLEDGAIVSSDDDWLDQSEHSVNSTVERLLETLEKDPMSVSKSPVIVTARKKLQDAS